MDYSNSDKYINNKYVGAKTIIGCVFLQMAMLLAVLLIAQPVLALDDTQPLISPLPGTDPDPASCPYNDNGNCKPDIGATTESNLPSNIVGNPINLMTGNKHQREVDFDIPGAMLSLRRMYNSGDSDSNRGLGQGWSHSFTVTLLDAGDGNLQIAQSDGGRIIFYPDGTDENGYPLHRAHQSNHGYLTYENERHYWHLSDGRTLKFNGQFLVQIDWPDQRELKLYYRQKRLSTVTDETGRVLQFAYTGGSRAEALPAFEENRFSTAEGYLESVTLPDGSVIGYDYDNKRNLTRVRFPDGTNREYHYENESWPNHLTGLTDRTGVRFASWTYDEHGRANSSEHAGGVESVTIAFPDVQAVADGQTVQTQITNSLGHASAYTWQQQSIATAPQLLSSEGAGCVTCPDTGFEYTYDEQGRLISATKIPGGNSSNELSSVNYQTDEKGRVAETRKTDSAGQEHLLERREYANNSHIPSRIIRSGVNADDGSSVEIEYDNNGNAIKITERGYAPVIPAQAHTLDANDLKIDAYEPIERITQLQWSDKKLISIDGPRTDIEDITQLQWDANNRLVRVAPPLSPALSIDRFDTMGRAVLIRLGQQTPVELEYNNAGQLLSTSQNGKVLNFGYDGEGRMVRISDAFERHFSIEHDEAGRLIAVTDDMGQRKQMTYNTESQRLSEQLLGIDGESISLLTMLFDEQGNISQTHREQAGDTGPRISTASHQQLLDGIGSRTVDAQSGGEFTRSLDMVNRVATFTDGSGSQARIGFDTEGRQTSVTDQRGNVTRYWYDDFGRRLISASSDTGVQVSSFDAADNLLERTNGDGSKLRYQHDAANRQTQRFDGVSTTTLSWDAANGKLIESRNENTTERFAYDKEARLIEHSRQIDGHNFRTGYRYDELGRVTEKQLPDGQRLYHWYHEDGVNRGSLRAVTTGGILGVGQQTIVAEIDLERRDGNTGYLAGNGVRSNFEYAADGQIKHIQIGGSLVMGFGFDEQGRITRIDDNGQSQQYQMQGTRLSQASTSLGEFTYQYDALSNRTNRTLTGPDGQTANEDYFYPPEGGGNRLLSRQDESTAQSVDYEYNGAGSTTEQGDLSFTYDAHQRPVEVHRSGQLIAQYAYNSFGERVKKIVYDDQGNATTTYFLFDGKSLSAQANEQGQLIDQYVLLVK